jgi:peptidoglycan hydrolase-like protein with peptidoglycan-binding domain
MCAWSKASPSANTAAKQPAAKSTVKKRSAKARRSWRKRGQQQIAVDRIREIQQALTREGYLHGEPSGKMDERTKTALMRYQGDNGWQSRLVPDSRAMIQLGLGPNHQLLNPDTAAIATELASASAAGGQR